MILQFVQLWLTEESRNHSIIDSISSAGTGRYTLEAREGRARDAAIRFRSRGDC